MKQGAIIASILSTCVALVPALVVAQTADTTAPSIPTASPAAGTYTKSQNVTLRAPGEPTRDRTAPVCTRPPGGGARVCVTVTTRRTVIHFTTDGSTPTTGSPVYESPILVDRNLTINAIAIDSAGNVSPTLTATYVAPDTILPTLERFSIDPESGTYGVGRPITITAVYSEPLAAANDTTPGSTMTVRLNTTPVRDIVLNNIQGRRISGVYTVQAGDRTGTGSKPPKNPPKLTIDRIVANTESVRDFAGNIRSNTASSAFRGEKNINNTEAVYLETVPPPAPTISPVGGTYPSSQNVTLSIPLETGTVIRYTQDGSTPTPESREYSSPILVEVPQTIKAIAVDAPGNISPVTTAEYVVPDTIKPSFSRFSTTTPNGRYATGATINITAEYNKDPTLLPFEFNQALAAGSSLTAVLNTVPEREILLNVISGSTISGTYTVQANDSNLGQELRVKAIRNESVRDAAGNTRNDTVLTTTTPNLPLTGIVVDGIPPRILSYSTTTANGTYVEGASVSISANYNEPLANDSSLAILLNTNPVREAVFNQVSGSSISGTYTVQLGDSSPDLHVDGIRHGTESVKDTVGNIRTYTPAAVYEVVNEGNNNIDRPEQIIIDAAAPELVSFSSFTRDGTFGTGREIRIAARYNEELAAGSSVTVLLNTVPEREVVLNTQLNVHWPGVSPHIPNTGLEGRYIVQRGDVLKPGETRLRITGIKSGGESVSDTLNHTRTDTPASAFASGNNFEGDAIVIDAAPPLPPVASPAQGTYTLDRNDFRLDVLLSAPQEDNLDEIRYTTDGTEPTITSRVYRAHDATFTGDNHGLIFRGSRTIKAIAIDRLGNVSDVMTATYTEQDTARPNLRSFSVEQEPGSYNAGSNIRILASYDETLAQGSTMTVVLNTIPEREIVLNELATVSDRGECRDRSGTISNCAIAGTYTIQDGDRTISESQTRSTVLKIVRVKAGSVSVRDLAGNTTTDSPTLNTFVNNTYIRDLDLEGIVLDTSAPTFNTFSANPRKGTYGRGDLITIRATYSENLREGSALTVILNTNPVREVILDSLSGSSSIPDSQNSISGRYIVASEDVASPLRIVGIKPGSESVRDLAGNTITIPEAMFAGDTNIDSPIAQENIVIKGDILSLVSFTTTTPDGNYGDGTAIPITANYNRSLAQGSTLTVSIPLRVDNQQVSREVVLNQVSGNSVSGTYTVLPGDTSSGFSVRIKNGTESITDTEGNTRRNSPGIQYPVQNATDTPANIIINSANVPDFAFVRFGILGTTGGSQGVHGTNATIPIRADYNQTLAAGSTLTVALNTIPERQIVLDNVSGRSVSGVYTVQAGDYSDVLRVARIISENVTDTTGRTRTDTPPGLYTGVNNLDNNTSFSVTLRVITSPTPSPTPTFSPLPLTATLTRPTSNTSITRGEPLPVAVSGSGIPTCGTWTLIRSTGERIILTADNFTEGFPDNINPCPSPTTP